MRSKKNDYFIPGVTAAVALLLCFSSLARAQVNQNDIYDPGLLKPIESTSTLKPGDMAPDFELKSVHNGIVSLKQFRGRNNVVLSFIPAAWTPVCSGQWPGYNIMEDTFKDHHAILLGISVDNIPTLYAWTNEMGKLWFPVLSDFWPHGAVAKRYGILRQEGIAERAIVIIDKQGIIRYIHVNDINTRPDLQILVNELKKLQ